MPKGQKRNNIVSYNYKFKYEKVYSELLFAKGKENRRKKKKRN